MIATNSFRRRRAGRAAAVAILILVLAVAILGAAWWVWPRTDPLPTADQARSVAEHFLELVRADRLDEAWQSTTAEFKNGLGRDRFRNLVSQHPWMREPLRLVAVETISLYDQPRAECRFADPAGGTTVRILAGQEGGIWRVDRLECD